MTGSVHVFTAERVGEHDPTRSLPHYRYVCSCGKRGKGSHPTEEDALRVATDHIPGSPTYKKPKPPKPPRPLTVAERFTRAAEILAENGFNAAEILAISSDIGPAWRGGIGLDGWQMSRIVYGATGEPLPEDAERS